MLDPSFCRRLSSRVQSQSGTEHNTMNLLSSFLWIKSTLIHSNPVAATKPAGWFQHCFNPSNEPKKSPTSSSLNLRFNHCTDLKMLSPHDLSLHQWFMVKFPHVFQCLALPKRREFREEAAVTMRWTSDVFDLLLRMHEEQPGGPSCAWKLAKFVVQLEIPALWLWLIMNCIYWTIFNQKTSM